MTDGERKARLAAALRDNLRKRKAQARGRRAADAPDGRADDGAPVEEGPRGEADGRDEPGG